MDIRDGVSEATVKKYGIRKISEPTMEQVRHAFVRVSEEELDFQFNSYENGGPFGEYFDIYDPPIIQTLHSHEVNIYHINSVTCSCDNDYAVDQRDQYLAHNFAGYNSTFHCYAFKGQRRLLPDFLRSTEQLFTDENIQTAFVRPWDISIPFTGFPRGWDREQFAMHAKIVSCILFLKPSVRDPLGFDEMASTEDIQLRDAHRYIEMITRPRETKPEAAATDAVAQENEEHCEEVVPDAKPEPRRYAFRQRKSVVSYR